MVATPIDKNIGKCSHNLPSEFLLYWWYRPTLLFSRHRIGVQAGLPAILSEFNRTSSQSDHVTLQQSLIGTSKIPTFSWRTFTTIFSIQFYGVITFRSRNVITKITKESLQSFVKNAPYTLRKYSLNADQKCPSWSLYKFSCLSMFDVQHNCVEGTTTETFRMLDYSKRRFTFPFLSTLHLT